MGDRCANFEADQGKADHGSDQPTGHDSDAAGLFAFDQVNELVASGKAKARLRQYEAVLYAMRSGVVILEPAVAGDSTTLQVMAVNQAGAEFFGEITGLSAEALDNAGL